MGTDVSERVLSERELNRALREEGERMAAFHG
jgi:hypothetical protein